MLWLLICTENVFFVWTCSYGLADFIFKKADNAAFHYFLFRLVEPVLCSVCSVASIESTALQFCCTMLKQCYKANTSQSSLIVLPLR